MKLLNRLRLKSIWKFYCRFHEQLEPHHQIEEVSAVENSSQVQLQQAPEIKMIADAVYNEFQISMNYQ